MDEAKDNKRRHFFVKTRPQHLLAQLLGEPDQASKENVVENGNAQPDYVIIDDDDNHNHPQSPLANLDPDLQEILHQTATRATLRSSQQTFPAITLQVDMYLDNIKHRNASYTLPQVPSNSTVDSVVEAVCAKARLGVKRRAGLQVVLPDRPDLSVYPSASLHSLGLVEGPVPCMLLLLGPGVHMQAQDECGPGGEDKGADNTTSPCTVRLRLRTGGRVEEVWVRPDEPLAAQLEDRLAGHVFVVDGDRVPPEASCASLYLEDDDIVDGVRG